VQVPSVVAGMDGLPGPALEGESEAGVALMSRAEQMKQAVRVQEEAPAHVANEGASRVVPPPRIPRIVGPTLGTKLSWIPWLEEDRTVLG